jgi:hypothetical protein
MSSLFNYLPNILGFAKDKAKSNPKTSNLIVAVLGVYGYDPKIISDALRAVADFIGG